MVELFRILIGTMERVQKQSVEYPNRILPRQAYRLEKATQIPGDAYNAATKHITLLMEAKSSMEVIVAAPTGGSCGAVPGTLIGVGKALSRTEVDIAKALPAPGSSARI